MAPRTAPSIKPIKPANHAGVPFKIIMAIIAPVKARIEPTDKSIPAVKITNVIPNAIKALTEA